MFWNALDPDLEIRGSGVGSSRPLDKGGPVSPKNFFDPRASVWSKNKGDRALPLDPPLKTFSCGTNAGSSEQARWAHLACSGSESSERRIRFMLPARGFSYIIRTIVMWHFKLPTKRCLSFQTDNILTNN